MYTMKKANIAISALAALGIGLLGFGATGCGLDVDGGVVEPDDRDTSNQQNLVVPRDGSADLDADAGKWLGGEGS